MDNRNPNMIHKRDDLRGKLRGLALIALSAHEMCLDGMKNRNRDIFSGVQELLGHLGEKVDDIDNNTVEILALYSPEARDLREFVSYLKITNEFERICNGAEKYAKNIVNYMDDIHASPVIFSLVSNLHQCTINAVKYAKDACVIDDADNFDFKQCLMDALVQEEKTDDLFVQFNKEIAEANTNVPLPDNITIFNSVRRLERAADHSVNIAKLMYYARIGGEIGQEIRKI